MIRPEVAKFLVRQYVDARSALVATIEKTEDQDRVHGPAMIAYLVGEGIVIQRLHPGEVFGGKCLVWDQGIYD